MSWFSFRPYVSVAERRRKAEKTAQKFAKQGRKLDPVQPMGRKIATTFWGQAWCDNLQAYSDFENRLPRGRSYLTNGSVIDLQIRAGKITALVQGSDLYEITINIDSLSQARWQQFKQASSGKVTNLFDLLQGKLSKDMLTEITTQGAGLFPSPKEIHMKCSCPDWADVCKHVAAVMYGIGTRLDSRPDLFFTLRGVDMRELISEAGKAAVAPLGSKPSKAVLADADLSELFGVDIEAETPVPVPTSLSAPARKTTRAASKVKAKPAQCAQATKAKAAAKTAQTARADKGTPKAKPTPTARKKRTPAKPG